MVYNFRITLDFEKEDVFCDVAINADTHLEDLHQIIVESFGFKLGEMASFYSCDDNWQQEEEFQLMNLSENAQMMKDTTISSIVDQQHNKMLYVYDFFLMWTFFIELISIDEARDLPKATLLQSHGKLPEKAPEKNFVADDFDEFESEFLDFDMDNEDFEQFDDDSYY